jgi:NADH:ubiquinone oxidoreductase subunit K
MSLSYQSPTIELVGGDDYEPYTPVFVAALLAIVAAAIAVGLALVYDVYRLATKYDTVYEYTQVELYS